MPGTLAHDLKAEPEFVALPDGRKIACKASSKVPGPGRADQGGPKHTTVAVSSFPDHRGDERCKLPPRGRHPGDPRWAVVDATKFVLPHNRVATAEFFPSVCAQLLHLDRRVAPRSEFRGTVAKRKGIWL